MTGGGNWSAARDGGSGAWPALIALLHCAFHGEHERFGCESGRPICGHEVATEPRPRAAPRSLERPQHIRPSGMRMNGLEPSRRFRHTDLNRARSLRVVSHRMVTGTSGPVWVSENARPSMADAPVIASEIVLGDVDLNDRADAGPGVRRGGGCARAGSGRQWATEPLARRHADTARSASLRSTRFPHPDRRVHGLTRVMPSALITHTASPLAAIPSAPP